MHPFDVSRETRRRLETYADLIRTWAGSLNLVSRADLPWLWDRHIIDALQLVDLVPDRGNGGVDIGSGSGIPGLVLAIAGDMHMDLIEADRRKAAFLREAARVTSADVTVHAHRAEDVELPRRPLVTARAVGRLKHLLPLVHRHVTPNGIALLPKGRSVDAEIEEVAPDWVMSLARIPSAISGDSTILEIRDLRRA